MCASGERLAYLKVEVNNMMAELAGRTVGECKVRRNPRRI